MTCVISSTPWHHFNDPLPWAPMTSDSASSLPGLDKHSGYASPGSETRKSSTSSGKKRASRAGTRSVSTLSAAQLERKRANDREAQRAIRQRTKDHIDHLERSINDLRGSHEANEKLVHVTQQRNRELEEEVACLRGKLSQAGFDMNLLPTERESLKGVFQTNLADSHQINDHQNQHYSLCPPHPQSQRLDQAFRDLDQHQPQVATQ